MGYRALFWLALGYVIWKVYQDLYEKMRSSNKGPSPTADTGEKSTASSPVPQWACQCLGVQEDTPPKEVNAAYRNLIKQYHPDRMEGMGQELRELADKRTKEINQAYVEFKKRW